MKKIINLTLTLLVFTTFAGCTSGLNSLNSNYDKNEETTLSDSTTQVQNLYDTSNEKVLSNIYMEMDYAIGSPRDLLDNSTIVITGTFLKSNHSFAKDLGRVVTETDVCITRVLKGSITEDTIKVCYYGGKVSANEFAKSLKPEQYEKLGVTVETFDDSKQYKINGKNTENNYVSMERGEYQVKPSTNTEYLMYLYHDTKTNQYYILSDSFGCREIKENKAKNPDTLVFESIDILN